MRGRRLAAYPVWLIYGAVWAFIGSLVWTTAAVYFVRDVGMSPLQLVLTGTALEVGYFMFEIPTGVVADLYSRRLSLVVAAAVSGVAMVITGAVPDVAAIIAAAALWGIGWTFRSGAEDAWLADELGPERLGVAYQRGAQFGRLAGLLGIMAAVGLALVDLRLPFVAGGVVTLLLALFLSTFMPEQGFSRSERAVGTRRLAAAVATARDGLRLVRAHVVLALVLGIAFISGTWAEGFDRLWEAHLLIDVGLPTFAGLDNVAWFGVLGAGTLLLSFLVAAPLVSRIERLDQLRLARHLFVLHALLVVTALGFAVAGSVWAALTAYWATTVIRGLTEPPFRSWLNGSITDSRVRATVLSIAGVAGSAGEWVGGPVLGVVGTRWSIRTALAAGALLLIPTLALFARAIRHHGREPELISDLDTRPAV
ncbi:MAG: MFS transporter [Jiangellaceae bacterium]|nr:MFS transporter [Jiangellaceae bacterium]